MLAVFAVLLIGVSIFVPNFFSVVNMRGLALSSPPVGIIACTMLFCLAAGGLRFVDRLRRRAVGCAGGGRDQSNAQRRAGLEARHSGRRAGRHREWHRVIARLGINALITTLATMQIVRGLFLTFVSDGKAVGVSESSFFSLGISSFLQHPHPGLDHDRLLRRLRDSAQSNHFWPEHTRHRRECGSGSPRGNWRVQNKDRHLHLAGADGWFCGCDPGISRMTSGQPATAQGLELQVISACVLGGVSLTGGVGTMTGVIVGVLIMGIVQNAMNLLNIAPFYQYVASGSILLAAHAFRSAQAAPPGCLATPAR